jgi:glutamate--cysteine ligase
LSVIYEQRLNHLARSDPKTLTQGGGIGLEKETLRVSPDGGIALTPHPRVLGSALTHPYITTDYSEALLEFITPPVADHRDALGFLSDIHRFVYNNVTEEMLWATSMPCVVPGDEGIPVARYGHSNAGRMKHVYRLGLGHRYGRLMQVIAGVHFNYSLADAFWPVYQDLEGDNQPLQDFISERYFCLIRNLQRFGWLIPYLFGASPAVCKSFIAGLPVALPEFDDNTLFGPYATSLRMSDIGYTNSREKGTGLSVSYNSLAEYVASLTYAIETPCPAYQRIGVVADGQYRQLNTNILQIENEYYSTMRPKQIPNGDEKPSLALARRGVRYVELRSLDVSAFDPMGVNETQLRFLEAFLIFCLLHESPPIDENERQDIDHNQMTAASRGREPAIELRRGDRSQPLTAWATEICGRMQGVCELLDQGRDGRPYGEALAIQAEVVNDPELTPSARMLATMRAEGEAFFHFAKRMSKQHQQYFKTQPLDDDKATFFRRQAQESLERQRAWEADDELSFPAFLERYFAQS